MNEQFFIVTEESPLFKDYFNWKRNNMQSIKIANEFAKQHDLPYLFSYNNSKFSIIAHKDEFNTFQKQLKKDGMRTEYGILYDFKKNSQIGKAWIAKLKSENFKILSKPFVPFYFSDSYGKFGWEFLEYDNKLYLKIESERKQDTPKGMIEIKGSEFYTVLERYEEEIDDE